MRFRGITALLLACAGLVSCTGGAGPTASQLRQPGDEIVVCSRRFHTGAPVILWTDPGGYNAHASPTPHFGIRDDKLAPEQVRELHDHGWTLPLLQQVVDQFVLHYDGSGVSRECFATLNKRGLSVHFMLDIDGTIYQTLDLRDRAWHATTSNNRSVGVEIANVGAFPTGQPSKIDEWYRRDADGRTRIVVPRRLGDGGVRTRGFVGRPARDTPVYASIQGKFLRQYDFTPEQYDSLVKLTDALCHIFPNIRSDYPHDQQGRVIPHKLSDTELASYHGVLGHYHIQTNKEDPGPAMQWDLITRAASPHQ